MREPEEAAGMILFALVHAVIDQAAGSKVRLIEARATGEHRNVDARLVHHANMRRKIGEQRIVRRCCGSVSYLQSIVNYSSRWFW